MPENNTEIETPEYISAYTFAERKKVSSQAVYARIAAGDITKVPFGKQSFIDWNAYKHIEFPHAKRIKANKKAKS